MFGRGVVHLSSQNEEEILKTATKFDGKEISSIPIKGTNLQVVGKKKCGVEGGAVVSLEDRDGEVVTKRQYMLKKLYRPQDKREGHYYRPNAKDSLRAFATRESLEGVNASVIEEAIALRIAKAVSSTMVPNVRLGHITDEKGQTRYCLFTEIAGQDEGEKFQNLGEMNEIAVPKDMWKSSFAITIGLLNDQDANKSDNIGVVSRGSDQKLVLFDLGHPSPDKFELDPKTLLPKSTSVLADILLWLINLFTSANNLPQTFTITPNIKDQLTVPERFKALQMIINKEQNILDELIKFESEISSSDEKTRKLVQNFRERTIKRLDYLKKVLAEHERLSPTDRPKS